MGWDDNYRYKILGYKIQFEDDTYYVFDLEVKETFREKPKKGEVVTEPVDTRKGYYSEDIAGTFGVPLEEHKKQTKVKIENGFVNMAMLTGDNKPVEEERQLSLDNYTVHSESNNIVPEATMAEVRTDVSEEVSYEESTLGQ